MLKKDGNLFLTNNLRCLACCTVYDFLPCDLLTGLCWSETTISISVGISSYPVARNLFFSWWNIIWENFASKVTYLFLTQLLQDFLIFNSCAPKYIWVSEMQQIFSIDFHLFYSFNKIAVHLCKWNVTSIFSRLDLVLLFFAVTF